jgi:tight adherence protein C
MDIILRYYYKLLGNMDVFIILALIFITTVAVVLGAAFLFTRKESLLNRLARLLPGQPQQVEDARSGEGLLREEQKGSVARMTRPLHNLVAPKQGDTRKRMRLKLIRAGFRSELAFYNFVAAKIVLTLALPAIYIMVRFFYKLTPEAIFACSLLAALGFFIPDFIVWANTRARQDRITRALPDALDLMVVCVESGYGLDMTFKRVGEEMRAINPDISDEFSLTNLEIRAGRTRDESFKEMALRTGVAEVHSLMTMLTQTSRFGTSLAKALRIHSDAMRVKRRQLAEEQAGKSAVKLVFPLILFIFPSLLIVLAGPAFIRIYQALLPALAK